MIVSDSKIVQETLFLAPAMTYSLEFLVDRRKGYLSLLRILYIQENFTPDLYEFFFFRSSFHLSKLSPYVCSRDFLFYFPDGFLFCLLFYCYLQYPFLPSCCCFHLEMISPTGEYSHQKDDDQRRRGPMPLKKKNFSSTC